MNTDRNNNIKDESQTLNSTCSIYVADLADYNSAILRGCWIDISEATTVDEIENQIQAMLTVKGHEEWAIYDYENLPNNTCNLKYL